VTRAVPWRASAIAWGTRVVFAVAVIAIALQWMNSRIAIVRQNQSPSHPVVPTMYRAFHSMATGLHEGRIGQIDLASLPLYDRHRDPSLPYDRLGPADQHRWVSFYTLDVGYSFIVEAARLAFPALPDNYLRALALQLVADAATVLFVFFVCSQWNVALGILAAYLYASNQVFFDLVSIPYYYYWDVPLTWVVLGALLLAHRRSAEASRWLTLAAVALGFGVWLRGSWWPLSLFLAGVAAGSPRLRRRLLIPVVAFAIVAAPQVIRSSAARGRLAFTTRAVWHVALIGLGYYPNPYGLRVQDEVAFDLTRQKYGVSLKYEDYFDHDQAARREWLSIWARDRGFVIRSFVGRLKESLAGSTATSVRSFGPVSNVAYRIACLLGCVAMWWRGADKRLLAIAAAGVYAIYVVLTCAFYFVGLAYDSVPEVALLVLLVGGAEAALAAALGGRRREGLDAVPGAGRSSHAGLARA
jgi:hypothetical protein